MGAVRAVPAVDVKGGRCVQLVGGRPEEERISLPDPESVARRWWSLGFRDLHVVDLDAALGHGHNRAVVARILASTEAQAQVGGGVRDQDAVAELLGRGAARVVVGTRAVTDPGWLDEVARAHPGRIMVAADVRDGKVLVRGWTEDTGTPVEALLDHLANLPVAGVLCTDVSREGRLEGIDRAGVRRLLRASSRPVWISGGISTLEELAFLADAGAEGAVLGMALYEGVLEAETVAREYGR